MKKILLSTFFALTILLNNAAYAQSDCGNAGNGLEIGSAVIHDMSSGNYHVMGTTTGVSDYSDYSWVVTDAGDTILGVANEDGSFSVDAGTDMSTVASIYLIAYNQAQVDAMVGVVTTDPYENLICTLYPTVCSGTPPQLQLASSNLSEIFGIIELVTGPLTIASVTNSLCVTLPGLGLPTLAFNVSESAQLSVGTTVAPSGNFSVTVSPVPADNQVNISITSATGSPMNVSIFDMTGRIVLAQSMPTNYTTPVDVANLPKGIYIVKATDGKETITSKLVK